MPEQVKISAIPPSLPQKKLRVCAYCRVSTALPGQADSYEIQIAHYTAHIQANPVWEFAGIYADEGISATGTAKRTALLRLISDCEAGLIDRILVKSISRFARNTVDCLKIVRRLKQLGVSVYFETENIDTLQYQGELALTVLSAVAQEESTVKSQNMKWRIQKNYESGNYKQPTMPYGYMVEKGQRFIPHPQQSAVVKKIYSNFLQGMSIADITRQLTERKIPPPKAAGQQGWSPHTVRRILKNERYAGDQLLQKTYMDGNTLKRRVNHGAKPRYYIAGNHAPIIDKVDFEKVQKLLQMNTKIKTQSHTNHSLKGKMICGFCGGTYSYQRIYIKGGVYGRWRCRSCTGDFCNNSGILQKDMERLCNRFIDKLLYGDKQLLKRMYSDLTAIAGNAPNGEQNHQSELQLLGLEEEKQNLLIFKAQGIIDGPHYTIKKDALEREIACIKQARAHLKKQSQEEQNESQWTLHIIKTLAAAENRRQAPMDIISEITERITVYPALRRIALTLKNHLVVTERIE